jgi:hypothetical protein
MGGETTEMRNFLKMGHTLGVITHGLVFELSEEH